VWGTTLCPVLIADFGLHRNPGGHVGVVKPSAICRSSNPTDSFVSALAAGYTKFILASRAWKRG
jgi:hypothetical protein